jgi:hypothetical protein
MLLHDSLDLLRFEEIHLVGIKVVIWSRWRRCACRPFAQDTNTRVIDGRALLVRSLGFAASYEQLQLTL